MHQGSHQWATHGQSFNLMSANVRGSMTPPDSGRRSPNLTKTEWVEAENEVYSWEDRVQSSLQVVDPYTMFSLAEVKRNLGEKPRAWDHRDWIPLLHLLLHLRFKKSTHCDFRVDRLVMDHKGSSHGHQVCLIILDLDPEAFRQDL